MVIECPGCGIRRKYSGRTPATLRCKKCDTVFPLGEKPVEHDLSAKVWRIRGGKGLPVSLRVLKYRLKTGSLSVDAEISNDDTHWLKVKGHHALDPLFEESEGEIAFAYNDKRGSQSDEQPEALLEPVPPTEESPDIGLSRKKGGWQATLGIASFAMVAAVAFFPFSRSLEDLDVESRSLKVESLKMKGELSSAEERIAELEGRLSSIDSEFEKVKNSGEEFKKAKSIIEDIKKSIDSNKIYLVISLTENRLYVKTGTKTLKSYTVSTGKGKTVLKATGESYNFLTPRGKRVIRRKEKKPVWIKPDWVWSEKGEELPDNISIQERTVKGELGRYRLKIGGSYSIHGTKSGKVNGKKETHGCIRVGRKDLGALFAMVEKGTEVYIY